MRRNATTAAQHSSSFPGPTSNAYSSAADFLSVKLALRQTFLPSGATDLLGSQAGYKALCICAHKREILIGTRNKRCAHFIDNALLCLGAIYQGLNELRRELR